MIHSEINLQKYHHIKSPDHTCVIQCLSIILNRSLKYTAKEYFDVFDIHSITGGYTLESCIEHFKRASIHMFWITLPDQKDRHAIETGLFLLAVGFRKSYPDHACISMNGYTSDFITGKPGYRTTINDYRCVYAYAPIFISN